MLNVQEFVQSECLVSSSGKVLQELSDDEMVAIYETEKGERFNLKKYLNDLRRGKKSDKEVVILKKEQWDTISHMITRNFVVTKK